METRIRVDGGELIWGGENSIPVLEVYVNKQKKAWTKMMVRNKLFV